MQPWKSVLLGRGSQQGHPCSYSLTVRTLESRPRVQQGGGPTIFCRIGAEWNALAAKQLRAICKGCDKHKQFHPQVLHFASTSFFLVYVHLFFFCHVE